MKLYKLRIPIIVAALLFALVTLKPSATAQSNALQISPVKATINANPGDKKQIILTLKNIGPDAGTFNTQYNNFTSSGEESGEPKIIDDPTFTYGIKTWLSGPSPIHLKSNETRDYYLTVSIPAGTKSGTYYGAVFFGAGGTSASVSTLLFINVGTITEQITVEELDTSGIYVDDIGQASGKFVARIKNTGNGYTVPKVIFEVLDDKKSVVETIDANKEAGGILPGGGIRKYAVEFSKRLEPNKGYSVKISATAGNNQPIIQEKNFVEAPIPIAKPEASSSSSKNNNILPLLIGGIGVLLILTTLIVIKKRKKPTTMPIPAPQQLTSQPQSTHAQTGLSQPQPPVTQPAPPESTPNDDPSNTPKT